MVSGVMTMVSKLIRFWFGLLLSTLLFCVGVANAGNLEDGVAAFSAKNYPKALELLRPEAEQGVAKAQGLLARMSGNGWGTSKNLEDALKWARLAAAQGDSAGQVVVGYAYRNGLGVTKDLAEALRWFRLAAAQGDALGQSNLGNLYQYGLGVVKDYDEAVRWFRLSAAQGNATGQRSLGYMYLNGFGVSKSHEEALKWFRPAVEQGDSVAQGNLGYMYLSGSGVTKNYDEATKWFRLGAEQGNAYSQSQLAYMYLNGFGVPLDYEQALKWNRLAADQGNDLAQSNLGHMHEYGLGVKPDNEEAARWYLLAAAQGSDYSKKRLERNWAMKAAAERVVAANAASGNQDAAKKEAERRRLDELARLDAEKVRQAADSKKQAEAEERLRVEAATASQRQRELEEQLKLSQAQATPVMPARAVSAHALIIGNGAYAGSGRLDNPVNDAKAMSRKLRDLGFTVTEVNDANRAKLVNAFAQFSRTAANAEITLLFYSGHGVQIYGTNYVLPIDVDQNDIAQATLQGVSLNSVIEQFMPGKTKLVFLDACRDNPLVRTASRGMTKGLAPISVSQGTLIAYSTKDGQVALDGVGQKNSPFTTALLDHLADPIDIAVVLRKVRAQVMQATGGKQEPWEYGSLTGGELILGSVAKR